MLSASELGLLDAVLARLLPIEDGDAMRSFAHGRAALQPELYQAGLVLLEGFDGLDEAAQEVRLERLEAHPSIALMLRHAVEGYYTSPAGLADIGFRVTA